MPYLNFKGKTAIETYHHTLPHHTFELDAMLSSLEPGQEPALDENLIVEGDNLLALKALLPTHQGSIKCVYIDPPYNTGNEGWVYNDKLTQPQFKAWLNKKVGTDEEDPSRHDKWCCMMYPRLQLIKELMREDGILFVSIDDNEAHNLRMLLDEIFGGLNYLATFYIQVRYAEKTLTQDANFHKMVESVLVYRKTDRAKLNKTNSQYTLDKFLWEVIENSSPAKSVTLGGKKVEIFTKEQYSFVKGEPGLSKLKEVWATGKILDGNSSGRFFRDNIVGRYSEDGYGTLYKVYGIGDDNHDFRYFTGPQKVGATKGKYFQGVPSDVVANLDEKRIEQPIEAFYNFTDAFGNCRQEGGVEFRSGKKPIAFLKTLFKLALSEGEDELVLDSFAGSGSTAHAVLSLNEDGRNHRFVLVQKAYDTKEDEEESHNICQTITAKRVRNVITGKKGDTLSDTFTYARLNEKPLLGEYRDLGENPPLFEEIAKYIYFTETSRNFLPKYIDAATGKIGEHKGVSYYLLYTPNAEDDCALDTLFLDNIAEKDPNKNLVVYCEKIALHRDDRLRWEDRTGKSIRPMLVPFHLK